MPGPVNDSYGAEFGTSANAQEIRDALDWLYSRLSTILNEQPPIYILDLVRKENGELIRAHLHEREWRLLRFAVERATESI